MTDSDYLKLLESSIEKMDELTWQREQLDIEIGKLQQFIHATVNLLPDEATKKFQARLAEMQKESEMASAGLTDAIRTVLQTRFPEWLTVTNVRDVLVSARFDFSSYKSNPLAAISTTLRRLAKANDDVEVAQIDGSVNAYRMPSAIAKLGKLFGAISQKPGRIGTDPKPDSAYESGMRGMEKPKRKSLGQRIGEKE